MRSRKPKKTKKGDYNMFCPKCGKEIAPGVQFCMNCGAEIPGVGQEQAPQRNQAPSTISKKFDQIAKYNLKKLT